MKINLEKGTSNNNNSNGSKNKSTPNKNSKKMQYNVFNNVFFYLLVLFIFILVANIISSYSPGYKKVSVGEVIKDIKDGSVQDVTVSGDTIEVLLKDGSHIVTDKESDISFDEMLKNNDASISKIGGKYNVEHRITLDQILSPILMFGFPLLILFFIFKQMRGQSNDVFAFGKSKAKRFDKGSSKVTFNDVAGVQEAKREMMEIVDFLKNPTKYRKLGARIPKGILLVGSSGVGKTLLAKAIAGEANVPFFSAAGSEFMEMLVGVGSSRVRDLFRMAREQQPSLIFIDEVDAIGRQRGMGIGGGHDEREQTLNQILTEMDGFDTRTDVIVLAATNRPDMLDPALVRPGRFDRRITIPLPDLKDRMEIIKIHMRNKVMAEDIDVEKIAKKTVGFSGADLENMLNEAAILAARENKSKIEEADIEEASLKVTIGSERKTMQTEEEKKLTAFHEAGHALVSAFVPEMDEVSRVSIVARGGSLGHTSFPPTRDRYNETKTRLLSLISVMLGGRAAEEVVFNELSIGASDDIDKSTQLARKMVTEYGMSSLGPISYDGHNGNHWLAMELGEQPPYSQEMASRIDKEVEKIIGECYIRSKKILSENREKLEKISALLLEKETIYEEEFKQVIGA